MVRLGNRQFSNIWKRLTLWKNIQTSDAPFFLKIVKIGPASVWDIIKNAPDLQVGWLAPAPLAVLNIEVVYLMSYSLVSLNFCIRECGYLGCKCIFMTYSIGIEMAPTRFTAITQISKFMNMKSMFLGTKTRNKSRYKGPIFTKFNDVNKISWN